MDAGLADETKYRRRPANFRLPSPAAEDRPFSNLRSPALASARNLPDIMACLIVLLLSHRQTARFRRCRAVVGKGEIHPHGDGMGIPWGSKIPTAMR